ncbi:transposase, partial [Shigella sonnei]
STSKTPSYTKSVSWQHHLHYHFLRLSKIAHFLMSLFV